MESTFRQGIIYSLTAYLLWGILPIYWKTLGVVQAFEILSKSVTTHVLKLIQESIESTRIEMTPEEAVILYKKIPAFKSEHGRMPDINSRDFNEKRMAESLIYLNKLRQERANANA